MSRFSPAFCSSSEEGAPESETTSWGLRCRSMARRQVTIPCHGGKGSLRWRLPGSICFYASSRFQLMKARQIAEPDDAQNKVCPLQTRKSHRSAYCACHASSDTTTFLVTHPHILDIPLPIVLARPTFAGRLSSWIATERRDA
jgi:hypothetical protein